MFYANDTAGNIGHIEVTVRKNDPPTNGATGGDQIPGYDLSLIFLGIFVISIISIYYKKNRFFHIPKSEQEFPSFVSGRIIITTIVIKSITIFF
jgi:hypothetical protein